MFFVNSSTFQSTVQLNSNLMLACNEPREDTRESQAFYKITRFFRVL